MDVRSIVSQNPVGIDDRIRPGLELLTVVGLLEAELWSLRAVAPSWLNLIVYGLIVATLWLSFDRRRRSGQVLDSRPMGVGRSWLEVLIAASLLSGLLVVAARFVGDPSETFEFAFLDKPPVKMAQWLFGKFAAALGQQLALQLFLWPVCRELTRSKTGGTFLAAAIFGLIHLPSITLVAITFLAGSVWIVLYRRTGRLAPLVLSHMILATLAHGGLPERLTYDMRVGLTAMADLKRFAELNNPKYRLAIRRLKDHRADLRHFSSTAYYEAQGGNLPGLIRGLYRDILDRPAADSDVAFWLGRKLPHPQVDIPTFFLSSDEYAQILEARKGQGGDLPTRRE